MRTCEMYIAPRTPIMFTIRNMVSVTIEHNLIPEQVQEQEEEVKTEVTETVAEEKPTDPELTELE